MEENPQHEPARQEQQDYSHELSRLSERIRELELELVAVRAHAGATEPALPAEAATRPKEAESAIDEEIATTMTFEKEIPNLLHGTSFIFIQKRNERMGSSRV